MGFLLVFSKTELSMEIDLTLLTTSFVAFSREDNDLSARFNVLL